MAKRYINEDQSCLAGPCESQRTLIFFFSSRTFWKATISGNTAHFHTNDNTSHAVSCLSHSLVTHSQGSASVVKATTQVNGEMGNLTPYHAPNPLTDRHQTLHTWLGPRYLPTRKISLHLSRGFFSPMREIARRKCLLGFFLGVLPTPHSRGPRTDFHAKYIKRRSSAQHRSPIKVIYSE